MLSATRVIPSCAATADGVRIGSDVKPWAVGVSVLGRRGRAGPFVAHPGLRRRGRAGPVVVGGQRPGH
eukprot:358363-Chlamydomonas_euryale.AAC.5